jgi:hypothetical protein
MGLWGSGTAGIKVDPPPPLGQGAWSDGTNRFEQLVPMPEIGRFPATGLVYARPREGAAGAVTTAPTSARGDYPSRILSLPWERFQSGKTTGQIPSEFKPLAIVARW